MYKTKWNPIVTAALPNHSIFLSPLWTSQKFPLFTVNLNLQAHRA